MAGAGTRIPELLLLMLAVSQQTRHVCESKIQMTVREGAMVIRDTSYEEKRASKAKEEGREKKEEGTTKNSIQTAGTAGTVL